LRTSAVNTALERSLSRDRLEKYLRDSNGDLDVALTVYERNTRLCEAFYTPLQSLEVCFRNSLHREMSAAYGPDWLTNGAAPLENDALRDIQAGTDELRHREVTPSGVVAELRFAFWVGLIGPRYDATLWRRPLYKAFRATGGHPRSQVHGPFNALRRLRNRIAHHEPIFHRPVAQLHAETIEATDWMCRDTAAWAQHHSRFEAVYTGHAM
jgi:hypothetical protein